MRESFLSLPRGLCLPAEIFLPCLSPVGRHHLTHPRCVGVAPTRHTSLSFIHRCAPHTRAFSFFPTSLYPLSLLSAHFGFLSARLRSGPTPAESPAPQPGNPPLQASPRLPDSDPLSGPRLTLTTWSRPPSSRPGLRPPDPEGAPSSRPHSGRAHAGPALTGPDPTLPLDHVPLYTGPGPQHPLRATNPIAHLWAEPKSQ